MVRVRVLTGGGFGCFGRRSIAGLGPLGREAKAAMETLDLTGGVDDALLTGEEGVARRAQLHPDFRPGRAGRPCVTAGANDLRVVIVARMDVRFHAGYLSSVPPRRYRPEVVRNDSAEASAVPP